MLFLKVKWEELLTRKREKCLYPNFWAEERWLARAYRFRNAYAICRRYQQRRRITPVQPYGETPLETAEKIGRALGLSASDTLFELGAGRGRSLLFYQHLFGCTAIGIEKVTTFTVIGQRLGIPLIEGDYFEHPLHEATAIYLYGTTLCRSEIEALCYKLKKLPLKPKIATVSYPLSHYDPYFKTLERFEGRFPWGTTDIFINQ